MPEAAPPEPGAAPTETPQQPPPVPTGELVLVASEGHGKLGAHEHSPTAEPTTTYYLEYDGTQSEPPWDQLFLATGGALAAAQSRSVSDFAVTGSQEAVVRKLGDAFSTRIRIPIPAEHVTSSPDTPNKIVIDNRAKLLLSASRGGVAINGTLVSSVSGQGAVYMKGMLKSAGIGNAPIPLTYAAWKAHSAVVTASGARIVDGMGRQQEVEFKASPDRDAALAAAETYLSAYGDGAWHLRQETLVYPYSKTLTKAVAKVPVGINDSGYDFASNILMQTAPYSPVTINKMFENAIHAELEFEDDRISAFEAAAAQPGKMAAAHAQTIAAALSALANTLVSYRADGRSVLGVAGSAAVAAESWLRQAPRTPTEANDCDGSAICIISLARAATEASAETRAAHPYMNYVRNVIFPHYQLGLAVVGASAAAASQELGGDKTQSLAGHATVLWMPTTALLRGLHKGAQRTTDKTGMGRLEPVVPPEKLEAVANGRLRAFYSADTLAQLPEDERAALSGTWKQVPKGYLSELVAKVSEGTTPATPDLYADGERAKKALANVAADKTAFLKVGATIGRSIKELMVGGADAKSPHRFYHDFVEVTFPRTTPLWTDATVRDLGFAAMQLVLASDAGHPGVGLSAAGASAFEMHAEQYAAVPLVVAGTDACAIIDYGSEQADLDVMPPRAPSMPLTAFETKQLEASLASLESLHDVLKTRTAPEDGSGHAVAYVLAINSLVNNPLAVDHFCERIKRAATAGVVDVLEVPGLAHTPSGFDAGKQVYVNALIG